MEHEAFIIHIFLFSLLLLNNWNLKYVNIERNNSLRYCFISIRNSKSELQCFIVQFLIESEILA